MLFQLMKFREIMVAWQARVVHMEHQLKLAPKYRHARVREAEGKQAFKKEAEADTGQPAADDDVAETGRYRTARDRMQAKMKPRKPGVLALVVKEYTEAVHSQTRDECLRRTVTGLESPEDLGGLVFLAEKAADVASSKANCEARQSQILTISFTGLQAKC